MKRLINALRRWWYGDNHGVHARPRGGVEFIDLTSATISRRPTSGRPPWETETAPQPVICLIPIPDPPALHPIVQAQLGASSVAEWIDNHFGHLAAA